MRENMQTIVLVMRRKPIAQSLVGRLQDNPDAQIIHASDYDNSEAIIFNSKANVVLIEAAESGDYGIAYCLELCERLRKDAPKCMLLLMCPEQDENSITRVVEAKRKKRIDDFVFYDRFQPLEHRQERRADLTFRGLEYRLELLHLVVERAQRRDRVFRHDRAHLVRFPRVVV